MLLALRTWSLLHAKPPASGGHSGCPSTVRFDCSAGCPPRVHLLWNSFRSADRGCRKETEYASHDTGASGQVPAKLHTGCISVSNLTTLALIDLCTSSPAETLPEALRASAKRAAAHQSTPLQTSKRVYSNQHRASVTTSCTVSYDTTSLCV